MKDSWKKYVAEFVGTFILVVIGCGAAVATGCYDGGTRLATAAAFGLAIIILAYSVGRISGGHVNPAVSFAMALSGKLSWKDFGGYVCAQVLGAIAGSAILGAFFGGYDATGANSAAGIQTLLDPTADKIGFGAMALAFVVELVLTFIFVLSILGVTDDDKYSAQGGLVIGLSLFGVHIVGIPLTGTSVNPARSLSAALFLLFGKAENKAEPMKEIWIFILAPLAGAALAALCWKYFSKKKSEKTA